MQPWTRPWGFSTGALARADFRRGLELVRWLDLPAIELSALRLAELPVLLEALHELDLSAYRHVSLHLPSAYPADREAALTRSLLQVGEGISVVVHPDAIGNFDLWRDLGPSLSVENPCRSRARP